MGRSHTLLYGIGAQKAATTWLHHALAGLDGVTLPPEKEVHYWDTWYAPATERYKLRAAAEWERRFGGSSAVRPFRAVRPRDRARRQALQRRVDLLSIHDPHHGAYFDYLHRGVTEGDLVADITPAYALVSRHTFADMARLHENARFVYIMRDPVDRFLSGLCQNNRKRIDKGKLSREVAAAFLLRAIEDEIALPHQGSFARSDYRRTIVELEAAVPRERIHYMFFETMFCASEMEQLGRFLGLSDFRPNVSRKVHETQNNPVAPDDACIARLEEALSGVYDFVRDRYGDQVPDTWRKV